MNSLGVVDPIRLPAPVGQWIDAVPRAAWLFIRAAVVAVFANIRNALGLGLTINVEDIVTVGAHTGLLMALPGIALIRNPKSADAGAYCLWWAGPDRPRHDHVQARQRRLWQ